MTLPLPTKPPITPRLRNTHYWIVTSLVGLLVAGLDGAAADKLPWHPAGRPPGLFLTAHTSAAPAAPQTVVPTQAIFKRSGGQQVAAAQNLPPNGSSSSSRIQPDEDTEALIRVDLPGPDRLFRREAEGDVFERIRQEGRRPGTASRVIFPEEQPVTTEPFEIRSFPPGATVVEPIYVCHGRLLFEQPNFERQGWEVGVLTPALNLGTFWFDMLALPVHLWNHPCYCYECSAGKCLPGDPAPLYGYPPDLTVSGLVGGAATYAGGVFIFP